MPKKQIKLDKGGYTTVWMNAGQDVHVDVIKDGKVILEWAFPKVPGHKSLAAAAALWEDQAILEAEND